MAVQGLLLPSANGLSVPARVFRQSLGALFRPSAATGSLGAVSGCLAGPDNTMGELTLLSDLLVRVQPFVAVVQGTHNVKQGQYTVPNDELVDLGIPAKDASQTRRAYIAVRVADSVEAGVASSAATDGAWLEIQPGALAASNPALPAATQNTLYLGELTIPSTASGLPVTITKYNPRTMLRGGILPIIADGATTAGHDGAPGTFIGQGRDHPTFGWQRWNGAAWSTSVSAIVPTPLGVNAGWSTYATNNVQTFSGWLDSVGMKHLSGWILNVNAFTPAGGEQLATLPQWLWPLTGVKFFGIPINVGQRSVQMNIATNGIVSIARPDTAIPVNAAWEFSICHYL
jgi:hypothetical protein